MESLFLSVYLYWSHAHSWFPFTLAQNSRRTMASLLHDDGLSMRSKGARHIEVSTTEVLKLLSDVKINTNINQDEM